jgi:hypothetical protein
MRRPCPRRWCRLRSGCRRCPRDRSALARSERRACPRGYSSMPRWRDRYCGEVSDRRRPAQSGDHLGSRDRSCR